MKSEHRNKRESVLTRKTIENEVYIERKQEKGDFQQYFMYYSFKIALKKQNKSYCELGLFVIEQTKKTKKYNKHISFFDFS